MESPYANVDKALAEKSGNIAAQAAGAMGRRGSGSRSDGAARARQPA